MPTYGNRWSGSTLATSPMRLANEVRSERSRTEVFFPIFSISAGMIEQRLALPQRSPRPLIVPWTMVAPASTAASEFATANSLSLCAWMPTLALNMEWASRTALSISLGRLPPLVSQRTRYSAPASSATRRTSRA